MKTIGMIGGMSWESTAIYYQRINELVKQSLGGLHSAKIILYSLDFQEIESLQKQERWDEAGLCMVKAAKSLRAAGADFLIICTNTMHKLVPVIESAVNIPVLHIADPTAEAIKKTGIQRIGLLGTRFTMEQDFYRGRLESKHGLEVIIPDANDRELVHNVIYNELCLGLIRDSARQAYRDVIRRLTDRGAQGIILGCTEISMLVAPSDSPVPLFDTTSLHALSAVEFALMR